MDTTNESNIQENVKRINDLNLVDSNNKCQSNVEVEIDQNKLTVDDLLYDHPIFGDVLKKIQSYSEKVFDQNLFLDLWDIINDILDLIERYQTDLTDEDLEVIENGCYILKYANETASQQTSHTDFNLTKQLFYKFTNFLNRNLIQNYLKNISLTNHQAKIGCFLTNKSALSMCRLHYNIRSQLFSYDKDRPKNLMDLFSLILNHIIMSFQLQDLNDIQVDSRNNLFLFLWNYTDVTNLIPELIQSECGQRLIDLLKLAIKLGTFS